MSTGHVNADDLYRQKLHEWCDDLNCNNVADGLDPSRAEDRLVLQTVCFSTASGNGIRKHWIHTGKLLSLERDDPTTAARIRDLLQQRS